MSEWCESRDADTKKGMRFNMTQAKSPTIPKEREEGGGLVGLQPVDMLVKKTARCWRALTDQESPSLARVD